MTKNGVGHALYWKIVDVQRAIDAHYTNCRVCDIEDGYFMRPCLAAQELLSDRDELIDGPIAAGIEEVKD